MYGLPQNVSIKCFQYNPNYFKEPKKFDLKQFLGKRKKGNLNCGTYSPFVFSFRMCTANRFAENEDSIFSFSAKRCQYHKLVE